MTPDPVTTPDAPPVAPALPTLAEQVASISAGDVLTIAAAILAGGKRSALQASTVEIMALARAYRDHARLAELTLSLLLTADELQAEGNADRRTALRSAVTTQIDMVAQALTDLGYGRENDPPPTEKENVNG